MFKRIFCYVLCTLLLVNFVPTEVYASEPESRAEVVELEMTAQAYTNDLGISVYATSFTNLDITISYSSAGMTIVIDTSVSGKASVIGVKDVEVQMKDGNDWITVATSSGTEVYNASACVGTCVYPGAIEGETYRVTCVHYANVEGYREVYHESLGFKCIY